MHVGVNVYSSVIYIMYVDYILIVSVYTVSILSGI